MMWLDSDSKTARYLLHPTSQAACLAMKGAPCVAEVLEALTKSESHGLHQAASAQAHHHALVVRARSRRNKRIDEPSWLAGYGPISHAYA